MLLAGTEDSAEQDATEGSMYLASTDLELMHDETTAAACPTCPGGGADAGSEQVVALRFNNIQIPRGAALTEAHVGFEIDEVNEPQSSDPVTIAIWGEYEDGRALQALCRRELERDPRAVGHLGRRSLHALHAVLGLERASTTLGCSLHYSGLHAWAKSPPYLVSSLDQTLCAWREPQSCMGRVQ